MNLSRRPRLRLGVPVEPEDATSVRKRGQSSVSKTCSRSSGVNCVESPATCRQLTNRPSPTPTALTISTEAPPPAGAILSRNLEARTSLPGSCSLGRTRTTITVIDGWQAFTLGHLLHYRTKPGQADRTLAILLHLARLRPRERSRAVIHLARTSVDVELEIQKMIGFASQSHAPHRPPNDSILKRRCFPTRAQGSSTSDQCRLTSGGMPALERRLTMSRSTLPPSIPG